MEGRHGRLKKWLSRGRCLGTLGFLAVFVLMSKGAALGSGWVLPLDGEAVFCLYYWISGEPMDDRDLEELSRGRGRPTYTDYKPSEMFTRNSLRRLRASLQQTIDGFDQTTRFVRTLTLEGIGRDTLKPEQLLPAPTPFIRAELSSDSRRKLMGLFRQALARCPKAAGPCRLEAVFNPVRVRQAHQQRNIALQPVFLPIRSVLMAPVRVSVLDGAADG